MLLDKVALMLALEVYAPGYRILELRSVCDGLFQYLYSLGVLKTHKINAYYTLEAFYEGVVIAVVQEFDIIVAVVKGILDKMLDEVLGQVHVLVDVIECHFGLYHPELGKVPWRIGVLCAERWAESIDLSKSGGSQFSLKLSAYGKGSLLSEEILGIVYSTLLVPWDVLEIERSNLEHLSGSLAVRLSDERGVQVNEPL